MLLSIFSGTTSEQVNNVNSQYINIQIFQVDQRAKHVNEQLASYSEKGKKRRFKRTKKKKKKVKNEVVKKKPCGC